jgi:hypothetical protein
VCLNPFNTAEWNEISGNTRRVIGGSQRATLLFLGVNPSPLAVDWFLSYPVATG